MNESGIRNVLKFLGIYKPSHAFVQGQYLMHPCPFSSKKHSKGTDYNPSFGIYLSDNEDSYYNCFTCHEAGPLERLPNRYNFLIRDIKERDYEAIAYIRKYENDKTIEIDGYGNVIKNTRVYEKPEPLNEYIYGNFYDSVFRSQLAVDYLKSRNITKKAIEIAEIKYDRDQRRIVFPVRGVDNKLYGFTGRTIIEDWRKYHNPPNSVYPKIKDYSGFRKRFFLLGEHNIKSGKPTMVVEGLFGYLSLLSISADQYFNIVALMGSVMTEEKAKTLISSNTTIFLMLDNDAAGIEGTQGSIKHLYGHTPIYVPKWPDDKIDPDQLTLKDIANIREMSYPYNKESGKLSKKISRGSLPF